MLGNLKEGWQWESWESWQWGRLGKLGRLAVRSVMHAMHVRFAMRQWLHILWENATLGFFKPHVTHFLLNCTVIDMHVWHFGRPRWQQKVQSRIFCTHTLQWGSFVLLHSPAEKSSLRPKDLQKPRHFLRGGVFMHNKHFREWLHICSVKAALGLFWPHTTHFLQGCTVPAKHVFSALQQLTCRTPVISPSSFGCMMLRKPVSRSYTSSFSFS